MDISIIQFLIVCPLVFLAGFVDAVAGGGGLISLPAYLIAGFPVHFAIGTNKISSAMGTTLTTVRYTKSGFIPWKQAIFCVVFALAGSACGANLALLIDDYIFKIIMLVILPLTGAYVMKRSAVSLSRIPSAKRPSSAAPSRFSSEPTTAFTGRARAPSLFSCSPPSRTCP